MQGWTGQDSAVHYSTAHDKMRLPQQLFPFLSALALTSIKIILFSVLTYDSSLSVRPTPYGSCLLLLLCPPPPPALSSPAVWGRAGLTSGTVMPPRGTVSSIPMMMFALASYVFAPSPCTDMLLDVSLAELVPSVMLDWLLLRGGGARPLPLPRPLPPRPPGPTPPPPLFLLRWLSL